VQAAPVPPAEVTLAADAPRDGAALAVSASVEAARRALRTAEEVAELGGRRIDDAALRAVCTRSPATAAAWPSAADFSAWRQAGLRPVPFVVPVPIPYYYAAPGAPGASAGAAADLVPAPVRAAIAELNDEMRRRFPEALDAMLKPLTPAAAAAAAAAAAGK